MKPIRWIQRICLGCLCAAALPAQAQWGAAFDRDLMMSWDFATIARPQLFGTARATAMGGAFVSLGADLTSLTLNPAGLGMYQHNEVTLSPLLSFAKAATPGTQSWGSNDKNRFALAEIGAAINLFEGADRGVTSLTLGFGLNRIADFNTRYSYASDLRYNGAMIPSIADVFARQMNDAGIFPEAGSGGPNGRLDYANPYYWPAVLAYKSAMTHVAGSGGNLFWEPDAIGPRASILRSVDAVESGSVNEFNFALGANINNLVYIGASLGIQSVHRATTFVYGEDYGYFDGSDNGYAYGSDGRMLPAQLEYADLWQRTVLDGVGVNFKLGVIVRPTTGLRIGVALHTPTYYSLERSYQAGMDYRLIANDAAYTDIEERLASPVQFDEAGDSWDFVSPTRLMLGGSYTFGKFAILSVDYERDWYSGIRVKNVPRGADFGPADYKADFKENFGATNTLRAGLEVRPLPNLAVRAGYGRTGEMLRTTGGEYSAPIPATTEFFTLGAGISLSRTVSLDLAYQHRQERTTDYRIFCYDDPLAGAQAICSDLYNTAFKRDFVTLTLGFHF